MSETFSKIERFALILLTLSFIIPFQLMEYRFFATELTILFFVVTAKKRGIGFHRVLPLLVILGVTVIFAYLFPSLNYSVLTSVGVYIKLSMYISFIYLLVQRCCSQENVYWLSKAVAIIAVVLGVTAIVDRYSNLPYFIDWRQTFYWPDYLETHFFDLYGSDSIVLDQVTQNSGLAPRTMDIIPWAIIGITGVYWIYKTRQMKTNTLILIIVILIGAAFSMPKRSSVITFSSGLLTFLLFSHRHVNWRAKMGIMFFAFSVILAVTYTGRIYDTRSSGGNISYIETNSALSRFMYAGFGGSSYKFADDRVSYLPQEIEFLLHNPRELLLGTGWIFAGGVWSKPHNTFIGLIVGGGIISLVALLISLIKLCRTSAPPANPPFGQLGLISFVSLSAEMMVNGYLFGRLEYLASILAFWIAWSVIMCRIQPTG